MSQEEIEASKEKFNKRTKEVEEKQKSLYERKYRGGPEDKFVRDAPFPVSKLELALHGSETYGRVPLTFSCRENGIAKWQDFCQEVQNVFAGTEFDDVTIQMLGSGVHGFSRNPKRSKKLEPKLGW